MIEFPKIPSTRGFRHNQCLAFVKYDGTNVGFEWSRKQGFHKARLRRGLFGPDDPFHGPAIPIFHERYADAFAKLFTDHKLFRGVRRAAVFGEYVGPNSFAGQHKPGDPMDVKVFDLYIDEFGFLGPKDFVKVTEGIQVAKCIYRGAFNGQFCEEVRRGDYTDKGVFEGVVIKAGNGGDDIEYAKVKTNAYMEKLRQVFGDRWMQFWE